MIYQALDTHRHQIRLITILPPNPDASHSAPVECHLHDICIDEVHFTPAYKLHLKDRDGSGARNDSEPYPDRLSSVDDGSDWIHVSHPDDNATTCLPDLRYEWGDFMALSYTWGDPTIGREILVNGHSLMVTKNFDDCLRVLRSKPYTHKGWRYWIDAICINQENIIERASQVNKMRELYTRAWTPLIWLGEQVEGSNEALDLMQTLASEFSTPDAVNRLTKVLHQNPDHFGKGRWRALNEIVCRRYWRRLWILQEAALGRSTTPVLCGERTLPWALFPRVFDLLSKTDEVINTYITNELLEVNFQFDLAIWPNLETVSEIQVLQDCRSQGQRVNMYRLLFLSRTVFATDPRDKVYGMLGLMDDSVARLIKPDYTDTVVNVYRSFALATIEGTGSLDILRHSGSIDDARSNIPSWLPDWRTDSIPAALTTSDTAFAASGSSLASAQTLPDSQLLSCRGYIIDRIDGIGCLWSRGWSADSVTASKGELNAYKSFEGARDALWKTLVASHSLPSDPLDPSLEADYAALLATPLLSTVDLTRESPLHDLVNSNILTWCVQSLQGNADFRVAGRPMADYFWQKADPMTIDASHLRDALMQRDRLGLHRTLITTEKGYIGLAPETVRQGDTLAILFGCSVPMILRRELEGSEDGAWRVVGECYVHGLMDGEAMGLGYQSRDLVLC